MGSSSPSLQKPPSHNYVIVDYRYCKVWLKKSDKTQHMQQYAISSDEQQMKSFYKMFQIRLQHSLIVRILYLTYASQSKLCGITYSGSVLIQRIPYRLCQFQDIPYPQALSILYICLKGYQNLYDYYGLFNIQSTMIGFDRNYCVKIWHHTDLSSPNPENPFCHTLLKMITSIILSVQQSSEILCYSESFSEFLEKNNYILYNFQKTISYLQKYCNLKRIKIQQSFPNIEHYLKSIEGFYLLGQTFTQTYRSSQKSKSIAKFSFKNNSIINPRQRKKQDSMKTVINSLNQYKDPKIKFNHSVSQKFLNQNLSFHRNVSAIRNRQNIINSQPLIRNYPTQTGSRSTQKSLSQNSKNSSRLKHNSPMSIYYGSGLSVRKEPLELIKYSRNNIRNTKQPYHLEYQ